MPHDTKYGRVTLELGSVGDDEPVFVFRGQDAMLPAIIDEYERLCRRAGSPERHFAQIDKARQQISDWQRTHPVRVPRSDGGTE